MTASWITIDNVVTVASQLMLVDEVAIQKEYQFELDSWISRLQEALKQYLQWNRQVDKAFSESYNLEKCLGLPYEEFIRYRLCTLLICTKNFFALLTKEAKEQLQKALVTKNQIEKVK